MLGNYENKKKKKKNNSSSGIIFFLPDPYPHLSFLVPMSSFRAPSRTAGGAVAAQRRSFTLIGGGLTSPRRPASPPPALPVPEFTIDDRRSPPVVGIPDSDATPATPAHSSASGLDYDSRSPSPVLPPRVFLTPSAARQIPPSPKKRGAESDAPVSDPKSLRTDAPPAAAPDSPAYIEPQAISHEEPPARVLDPEVPLDIVSALFFPASRAPAVLPGIFASKDELRLLRNSLEHARTSNFTGVRRVALGFFEHRSEWLNGVIVREALLALQSEDFAELRFYVLYGCHWKDGVKSGEEVFRDPIRQRSTRFFWIDGQIKPALAFPELS